MERDNKNQQAIDLYKRCVGDPSLCRLILEYLDEFCRKVTFEGLTHYVKFEGLSRDEFFLFAEWCLDCQMAGLHLPPSHHPSQQLSQ